jgi:hypothetical protein
VPIPPYSKTERRQPVRLEFVTLFPNQSSLSNADKASVNAIRSPLSRPRPALMTSPTAFLRGALASGETCDRSTRRIVLSDDPKGLLASAIPNYRHGASELDGNSIGIRGDNFVRSRAGVSATEIFTNASRAGPAIFDKMVFFYKCSAHAGDMGIPTAFFVCRKLRQERFRKRNAFQCALKEELYQ